MEELRTLLENMLTEGLEQIVLSNSVDLQAGIKAKIRPVLLKGELKFQETLYRGTQVFHNNYNVSDMADRIAQYLCGQFRQAQMTSDRMTASVLVSKKGKMTVKTKSRLSDNTENVKNKDKKAVLTHDRVKQYILEEGRPVDFLVGLGVQTPDGKVNKAKYDKFRQINRYLEFIEDVLEELPKDRPVRIIDFGCGKSYLTFAMYYYLHELQGRDILVTGLDLKADVIDRCNELARQCGYDSLQFERGDISTYEGETQVDMVVSLHACDTATDYALEKAVRWGAKVIMAVPCCQHEVNGQIRCDELAPVLKFGLIKERVSALVTDAIRANLLESQGYDAQILEFIDMEHTPKNLLIRAVKKAGMRPRGKGDISDVLEFLQISPKLAQLLRQSEQFFPVPPRGQDSRHCGPLIDR